MAHSQNFAYCTSFDEDSKASTEYVLQRAAENVWNFAQRSNKTVQNTPQFSFLPKVSSLSFSERIVFSRIKAPKLLSFDRWLKKKWSRKSMIDLFGPASGFIAHQVSKWLKGSNRILYVNGDFM